MKGVKLLVLSIVTILFTYSAQAQCRITGWSYMANKTTACDSFRTFNVVIMDSPLVYKPGTIGQVMILGPNKKVTTSAIGSVLKARNGLTISNDTLYLGGTLTQTTGLEYEPHIHFFYTGDIGSNYVEAYGNAFEDSVATKWIVSDRYLWQTHDDHVKIAAGFDSTAGNYISIESNEGDTLGAPVYGLYLYDNGGNKTANIYYGIRDGAGHTRDVSRIESNKYKVHIRHYSDPLAIQPNYNGVESNSTYSQLEVNKTAEDGYLTGLLWRGSRDTGYALYNNGVVKALIDTSGNVDFLGSDSASIYSLTPSKITLAACNNCSGNGIVGRLLVYLNGLWYQLGLTPP
jgi:hypothetical protein